MLFGEAEQLALSISACLATFSSPERFIDRGSVSSNAFNAVRILPLPVVPMVSTCCGNWEGLVFRQPDGSPVYVNNVSRTFSDLLRKSGLPVRRFHDLRHACASLLMAQGVPPSTVMEILGHSNLATTMHIYREVSIQAMGEAAGVMDRILGAG